MGRAHTRARLDWLQVPDGQGGGSGSAGWTPLQLAAYNGHATAVRTLLECGARGSRAAHLAARHGHGSALEALLEWGMDANAADEVRVRSKAPGNTTHAGASASAPCALDAFVVCVTIVIVVVVCSSGRRPCTMPRHMDTCQCCGSCCGTAATRASRRRAGTRRWTWHWQRGTRTSRSCCGVPWHHRPDRQQPLPRQYRRNRWLLEEEAAAVVARCPCT